MAHFGLKCCTYLGLRSSRNVEKGDKGTKSYGDSRGNKKASDDKPLA